MNFAKYLYLFRDTNCIFELPSTQALKCCITCLLSTSLVLISILKMSLNRPISRKSLVTSRNQSTFGKFS